MVFKSSVNNGSGGGGGVTSLQGETGAINLTSAGGTVVITTPTGSTINLETSAGGGNVNTTGSPALGNIAIFSGATTITNGNLAGDVTTNGSPTVTLATVNANVGSYGSVNSIPIVTVNAKGLTTAVSTATINAPAANLTGTTIASNIVNSSLTKVGTLATATWNASTITVPYGGTGVGTLTANAVLLGEGTGNVGFATTGTSGRLLVDNGSGVDPSFAVMVGDATLTNNATLTLTTVNSNIGTFGSTVSIPVITVNAKGLTTAVSTVSITGGGSITSVVGNNGVTASTAAGAVTVGLATAASTSVLANLNASVAVPTALQATADGQSLVRKSGTLQWSYSAGTYYIDVRDYGATPDVQEITDLVCTSGSPTATSATANFTSAITGKRIRVYDFTNSNYIADTTATFVNSTTITLGANASASLSAANGITWVGTDNATSIQNALNAAGALLSTTSINANQPLGIGKISVLFPTSTVGSGYLFASTLVVPTNVVIDADAMLISCCGLANNNANGQANRTWAMCFKPGASIKNLQMDCTYAMGVQIGQYQNQSHSYIMNFTQWSVGGTNQSGNIATSAQLNAAGSGYAAGDTITLTGGTGTKAVITVDAVSGGAVTDFHISNVGNYSATPSNPVSQGSTSGGGSGAKFNLAFSSNSQIGLDVSGNDYFIDYYWVKGANIGWHGDQCNDVLVNQLFVIGCGTGFMLTSCEETFILDVQVDTGSFAGGMIDGCHNCQVNGHAFAINSTALTYGIGIGQNDATNACHNLLINWTSDHHGGDAMRVANVTTSVINANITNATIYAGGGTNITNATVYGSGVASTVVITQNRDSAIVFSTGTIGGILNDYSAGSYVQYGGYTDGQFLVGKTSTGGLAKAVMVGDATMDGNATITLKTVNSNIGTYGSTVSAPVITVNAKGLVTAVSTVSIAAGTGTVTTTGSPAVGNIAIFSGATSITNTNLAGDVTTSGGSTVTLATVNSNIGSYGSTNSIPIVTVNAKGLTTGVSTASISVLTSGLPANQTYREISFSLDGQGSAIASGGTWYLAQIPYSGNISSWSLVADQSGSINIDVWKKNAAVPTVSSTITASFLPGLTSTQAVYAQAIPGWSSTVTAGDCFAFKVNAATTVQKANLTIQVTAS